MASVESAETMKHGAASLAARCSDYVELTKPRITVMMLVSVAVAAYVARWGRPDLGLLVHTVIGTALVACSASAANQWLERFSDRLMARTERRPLPTGRMSSRQVLTFAGVTLAVGASYLFAVVQWDAAAWAVGTWIVYVMFYTPLKRRSEFNTAVGAISGAMPLCIGWAAAGGAYDLRMAALFMTMFLWQFPHFMAIAWLYRHQYAQAGLRMMTVVEPSGRRAGVQAVLAAAALLPVSLVPAISGPAPGAGWYAAMVLLLGVAQLACAVIFFAQRTEGSARLLLRASLIYLPALLGLLLIVPLA
ncbi:MAG: heme o synthase [Planctomycetota bacterium]